MQKKWLHVLILVGHNQFQIVFLILPRLEIPFAFPLVNALYTNIGLIANKRSSKASSTAARNLL
jgi:hypothetical protein